MQVVNDADVHDLLHVLEAVLLGHPFAEPLLLHGLLFLGLNRVARFHELLAKTRVSSAFGSHQKPLVHLEITQLALCVQVPLLRIRPLNCNQHRVVHNVERSQEFNVSAHSLDQPFGRLFIEAREPLDLVLNHHKVDVLERGRLFCLAVNNAIDRTALQIKHVFKLFWIFEPDCVLHENDVDLAELGGFYGEDTKDFGQQ